MVIHVNPNVKFSYNIAKGSSQQRIDAVGEITDKLCDKIIPRIHNDSIKVDDFKSLIKSVLPESKVVKITPVKTTKDYCGESDYIYGKHNEVIGQTIGIPFKRGKIKSTDIPVCIHEFVHVLDTLFNPKYVARTNKMNMHDQYNNNYDKCFDILYHHETCKTPKEKEEVLTNVRKSVIHALTGRSKEDKINLIQELRNEMQTEYNAYKAESFYAKKLNKAGVTIDKDSLKDYSSDYMFKEKGDLLKQIGLELVADSRKSISRKQRKNNAIL